MQAYASDGLWLISEKEAAQQAEKFAEMGFKSIKMRLGRINEQDDLAVLTAIKSAVGDKVEVFGDVNQGWTINQAVNMLKRVDELGLKWLEEPIEANDIESYSELTKMMNIPITAGENLYGIRSFHSFLQQRALSIYTPDLQRTGGISGWKRILSLLELYNVKFSLHLFPEFSIHLLAAVNNSEKLEWMSWATKLFKEPLECKQGIVEVPNKPGIGTEWNEAQLKKFEI